MIDRVGYITRALLAGLCLGASSITPAQSLAASSDTNDVTVTDLCLTDSSVECWTPWNHPCRGYDPDDLYDGGRPSMGSMNGGAGFYDEHGLQVYIYQELACSSRAARLYVMDMGSVDSARSLYTARKATVDSVVAVPGHAAAIERYGIAYVIYAWFGRFYLEMTLLTGAADSEVVRAEARRYLTTYEALAGCLTNDGDH